MEKLKVEKNCFNCKYFEAYYVKTENGFMKLNDGFCKFREYFGEIMKPASLEDGCSKWNYNQEEQQRENYLSSIRFGVAYCALKLEKMAELLENLDK